MLDLDKMSVDELREELKLAYAINVKLQADLEALREKLDKIRKMLDS